MAQSTILGDTGNGATITFATGITAALKVRNIDPSGTSIQGIPVDHLGSTGIIPTIPQDLSQAETLSIEVIWDTFFVIPVVGLDLGNVTVTYPLRGGTPGETTPATQVAKGFVRSVKPPRLANNELQVLSMTIEFTEPVARTKST